ncbi:hypothetical protein [Candidatus Pyrohabitans sp.]
MTALEFAKVIASGEDDKKLLKSAQKAIKVYLDILERGQCYYDELIIEMKRAKLTEFEIGVFFTHFKILLQPETLVHFAEFVQEARKERQIARMGAT